MKVNEIKVGAILTYLSTGLSFVITLLYTPLMLNMLGQNEYGVYTLVSSVVANLGILSLGFASAYVRFYSRYKVKNDCDGLAKLNGLFLTVFSIIALIALIAGTVLVLNVHNMFKDSLSESEIHTATILMCILVVNVAITFPANVFTSFITANEKYVFLKLAGMFTVVCSPLLNLLLLYLGFGSIGMVSATLLLNVLVDIAKVVFSIRKLEMRVNFKNFDFSLLKEIFMFSFFIFLNIITDQINWNVDKFLLGIFQTAKIVAIYGVAAQLNNMYITISHSLSSLFIPRVNKLVAAGESDNEITGLFIKVGRIQFFILSFIIIIYVFFGKYFFSIWAGKEYNSSYYIGLLLILAVSIEAIQTLGIEIQRAKNLHKFRSVVCFGIALANIIVSIPMCRFFGAVGAAIGTAVSLVVGNGIIMNVYYHKKVGINITAFWKSIFSICPMMIPPVIYGLIVNHYFKINSFLQFVIQMFIMFIIYILSAWILAMNKSEKNLILIPLSKIKNRITKGVKQ